MSIHGTKVMKVPPTSIQGNQLMFIREWYWEPTYWESKNRWAGSTKN